jgi:hypothetical protein
MSLYFAMERAQEGQEKERRRKKCVVKWMTYQWWYHYHHPTMMNPISNMSIGEGRTHTKFTPAEEKKFLLIELFAFILHSKEQKHLCTAVRIRGRSKPRSISQRKAEVLGALKKKTYHEFIQ